MLFQVIGAVIGVGGLCYGTLKMFYPWVFMDLHFLKVGIQGVMALKKYERQKKFVIDHFEEQVTETPGKVCIIYEDQAFTYKEINNEANRIATRALSLGLKCGDVVAVMMFNEPAFVWTYLGLLKIGVCISFINTSLRGKSLLHCLTVSEANAIFLNDDAPELSTAVYDILSDLPDVPVYLQGYQHQKLRDRFQSFDNKQDRLERYDNPEKKLRGNPDAYDIAMYIFTSGTTGLPKPARISHKRSLGGKFFGIAAGIRKDDIIFVSMPLFHSSGLLLGMTNAFLHGATCVLARKFSKTHFMDICRKHSVTVFIYIGELCRFLLTNEKNDFDKHHSIRLALGNGLRRDIFGEFKERFAIPHIVELYAATEAPFASINLQDVIGSCGRSSPLLERFFTLGFFEWDVENECLVRDKKGHCVPVKIGEPGLLLIAINKVQTFDGYKAKKEVNESKIVKNVCKDGDVYFNSGDLITRDDQYNMYFNDRIGDTFRWKGENVSTTEVSNILTDVDFVVDACVYGVTMPGCDGRAGMAALLVSTEVTSLNDDHMKEISLHCNDALPVYARPVLLRITYEDLDMTATAKQNKIRLKKEGFDINQISDVMYYYNRSSQLYEKYDGDMYSKILDKSLQF